MIFYYIFAAVILLVQLILLLEGYRHLVYTWRTYRVKPSQYQPRAALISPCKGIDTTFDRNINSFFDLDYPDYEIFFVVQSAEDPAYERLQEIIAQRQLGAHSVKARLLVAPEATTCSQKLQNLLTACVQVTDDFEVLAFVDSDACLKPHFLSSLVHPLRRRDVGAATGYRWYVPTDSRLSSSTLSALNGMVASLLGPHGWNSTWGGATAIRREIFEKTGVGQAWRHACSDDYALTRMVKKAGLEIIFVPACFVASYEQMSWSELFSFARRQFIITRVMMPRLWWMALLGWGHFLAAFWGGLAVSLTLWCQGSTGAPYAAIVPGCLVFAAMFRGLARQVMIRKILPEDRDKLLAPALLDIFLGPLVGIVGLLAVVSAAGTRTIEWRGIKYRLIDLQHTQVVPAQPTERAEG